MFGNCLVQSFNPLKVFMWTCKTIFYFMYWRKAKEKGGPPDDMCQPPRMDICKAKVIHTYFVTNALSIFKWMGIKKKGSWKDNQENNRGQEMGIKEGARVRNTIGSRIKISRWYSLRG